MDSHSSPEILLTNFDWNLQRFDEMLKQDPSDYFRSAALQRFGLTCISALKCLQAFAEQNGGDCHSLDECIQVAGKAEWISIDDTWKSLLSAHDKISKAGNGDEFALEIFENLGSYHGAFKELYNNLVNRV